MRKITLLSFTFGSAAACLSVLPGALSGCDGSGEPSETLADDVSVQASVSAALTFEIRPGAHMDKANPFYASAQSAPAIKMIGTANPATFRAVRSGKVTRLDAKVLPRKADIASAVVQLAERANAPFKVQSEDGAIEVKLLGAADVKGHVNHGLVVYPAALQGADVLHRPIPEGTEDFAHFVSRPAQEQLVYEVDVRQVAGVRVVDGSHTVEFLRADGTPILRMNAPYGVTNEGTRFSANVSVSGCQIDRDPSAPWGRAVVAPASETCRVEISWAGKNATYPALVDPTWVKTGNPGKSRSWYGGSGAAQALLPSGKVLAAGGSQIDDKDSLDDAELFDPVTNTWAATGTMSLKRGDTASATVFNDGTVLVAGGGKGDGIWGDITDTTEIYSEATGTWTAGPTMAVKRLRHRAVALGTNKVLFMNGGSATEQYKSAEILNTVTKTFSPAADVPGVGRHDAGVVKLDNNRLMVVSGGAGAAGGANDAYIYDITTDKWTAAGTHPGATRYCPKPMLLNNGDVIMFGGVPSSSGSMRWTKATNTWAPVPSNSIARDICDVAGFNREAVYDGKILLGTGTGDLSETTLVEFDPATGALTPPAARELVGLGYANQITLKDGRLLVFGGYYGPDNGANPAAEVTKPKVIVVDAAPDAVADAAPDAKPDAATSTSSSSSTSSGATSSTSGGGSTSGNPSSSGTLASSSGVAPAPAGAVALEGGGCSTAPTSNVSNWGILVGLGLIARSLRRKK
jgi:Kelch motif